MSISQDSIATETGEPELEHGYWRSLAELDGKADVGGEDEFPATSADNATSDPLSRRNFFQLMGASMALAGVAGAGCKRWEKDHIVPLARRPEDQVPGNTQQYASLFELGGVAQALLVTSFEGRPIKVNGNPEHPFAGGGVLAATKRHGASSAFAQASILSLYDPDRSQAVLRGGAGASIDAFKAALAEARAQMGDGAKVRILSEASSSPTIAALRRQLAQKLPRAQWHEWEALSWDNEREGMRLAFGRPLRPLARLEGAATVVALDGDLFTEHPAALRYARDFAKARKLKGGSLGEGKQNRLWAIESVFTGTGALADHRLPLRAELVLPLLAALDAGVTGGSAPTAEFLGDAKVKEFVEVLSEELRANRGRAVIIAGRRQPPAVHALVAKLNAALGAPGTTLNYLEDPQPERPSHTQSIGELGKAMAAGAVEHLLILGGNPVYDAPADLEFAAALAKVPTSIHLSEYANETSAVTTWHVPRAHAFEAWTDGRSYDGTITIGQPLIMPMYGGLAASELLGLLVGNEQGSDVQVRATFDALGIGGLGGWRQAVHDGFVAGTQLPAAQVTPGPLPPVATDEARRQSRLANGALEVVFAPSPFTYDGRFANNGWLQETPDYLTKVTWDNYALVSPATATELGVSNDSLISVEVGGRKLEVACYTMPGQARSSIGLVLGGGRTRAGKVGGDGKKKVGFDVGKLRTLAALDIAAGAKVTATGKSYALASTQEHWDMRGGIDPKMAEKGIAQRLPVLVRETTTDEANKGWKAVDHGNFGPDAFFNEEKAGRGLSLFKEQVYKGHRWAMATDLSSCVACNACLVACQSENNIPVVGKSGVQRNREMNWIRIDRYFKGPVDDPEIAAQPVACQQCENAPCEQVCPVGATTHSDEGLNDMAYNRCVGTRYCLNNCPYRVRRFNFFDYQEEFHEARNKVRQLLFNPEVTVRGRGVMEKCTFCVQRIQNGKIKAKREGRSLVDGEITTACQDACPTEAIVFGDLADPTSRVSELHKDGLAYGLLDDLLYTRPRNQYLARVKNPHPKLAKAKPADKAGATHAGGHS